MTRHAAPIFAYLQEFIGRHGYGPTIREIQAACGVKSNSNVVYQLGKLEDAGKIICQRDRNRRVARGIRLVGAEPETIAQLFRGYRCSVWPNEVEQRMADVIGGRAGALVFIPDPVDQASEV